MHYTYKTKGTCSQQIEFDLNGNVVTNVSFLGGCNGNLKAISSLVDGMTVEDVEKKVAGIQCGFKGTSCADQFSIALKEAFEAAAQAQQ